MAIETHIHDGSNWRKAKEIYVHDGSDWRKVKKAYCHDGSAWRLVFSLFDWVRYGDDVSSYPASKVVECGTSVVYCVASNVTPHVFISTGGAWTELTGIPSYYYIEEIACDKTTSGLFVNASGNIYRWNGTTWSLVAFGSSLVSSGSVVGIVNGSTGSLAIWNGSAFVDVSADYLPYPIMGDGTDAIYTWANFDSTGLGLYRWASGAWTRLSAGVPYVGSPPLYIATIGSLKYFSGPNGGYKLQSGTFIALGSGYITKVVNYNNVLYGIDTANYGVVRYTGSQWEYVSDFASYDLRTLTLAGTQYGGLYAAAGSSVMYHRE